MDRHRHLLTLGVCLLLTACSPKIVERVVIQHDTTTVHHRDTSYHRDSVYIKEWVKGDTVHIYEYRDRFVYKDRWRDSVVVKVDSLTVETVKEVKVEKPLSWWKRVELGLFWWVVALALGLGVWTFRKPLGGWFTKIVKMIF